MNIIEFLIENGADVNLKNNFNCTPLHSSVARGTWTIFHV